MGAEVDPQPAADRERHREQRRPAVRASAVAWLRAAATRITSSESATSISDSPRWKRPASECGHGSSGTDDLAPAVGVGAGALARAGVAQVRLGAVAHEAPLVVELVRPQVLALGALPVVVLLVVGEARGPVAQRAPVRVRRQPLEHDRRERAGSPRSRRGAASRRSCQLRRARLVRAHRRDPLRLRDLREEDVLRLLERDALDRVADPEIGDVERRERRRRR